VQDDVLKDAFSVFIFRLKMFIDRLFTVVLQDR